MRALSKHNDMLKFLIYFFAFTCAVHATPLTCGSDSPLVHVRNGTLRGLALPEFDEELFLGVPFAEPPLGDLRLRRPIPYQSSWHDARDATTRSVSCAGYAGFDKDLTLGEGRQYLLLQR